MKGKFVKSANSFMKTMVGQFENPKPNSLLYNRALLYFIFFLSLFQLYTFSVSGNSVLAITFLLVGFLTSFFSKNMIVILVIALVFTGVLQLGISRSGIEGMTEGNDPTASAEPKKDEAKPDAAKKEETTEKQETVKEEKKNEIVKDGQKLESLQNKILENFKEIEPYMSQAEVLVDKMNNTATTLQNTK